MCETSELHVLQLNLKFNVTLVKSFHQKNPCILQGDYDMLNRFVDFRRNFHQKGGGQIVSSLFNLR